MCTGTRAWVTNTSGLSQSLIKPGEAVCDVMAGVGAFAVPTGKKDVSVWANDLKPASHDALEANIERNKVGAFVRAHNTGGREFIRSAIQYFYTVHSNPETNPASVHGHPVKYSRTKAAAGQIPQDQSRKLQEDHCAGNVRALHYEPARSRGGGPGCV